MALKVLVGHASKCLAIYREEVVDSLFEILRGLLALNDEPVSDSRRGRTCTTEHHITKLFLCAQLIESGHIVVERSGVADCSESRFLVEPASPPSLAVSRSYAGPSMHKQTQNCVREQDIRVQIFLSPAADRFRTCRGGIASEVLVAHTSDLTFALPLLLLLSREKSP